MGHVSFLQEHPSTTDETGTSWGLEKVIPGGLTDLRISGSIIRLLLPIGMRAEKRLQPGQGDYGPGWIAGYAATPHFETCNLRIVKSLGGVMATPNCEGFPYLAYRCQI